VAVDAHGDELSLQLDEIYDSVVDFGDIKQLDVVRFFYQLMHPPNHVLLRFDQVLSLSNRELSLLNQQPVDLFLGERIRLHYGKDI